MELSGNEGSNIVACKSLKMDLVSVPRTGDRGLVEDPPQTRKESSKSRSLELEGMVLILEGEMNEKLLVLVEAEIWICSSPVWLAGENPFPDPPEMDMDGLTETDEAMEEVLLLKEVSQVLFAPRLKLLHGILPA